MIDGGASLGADGFNSNNQNGNGSNDDGKSNIRRKVVRNLDFFPKVDQDLMVKTERGGLATLVGYIFVFIFVMNELSIHFTMNRDTTENLVVDTSLSKKMTVNINITFPAIACEDLHLDVMDVAGDSQVNLEETLIKRKLDRNGIPQKKTEMAQINAAHKEDVKTQDIRRIELPKGYCGPCYGAQDKEEDCCNSCDDVIAAYKNKRWNTDHIQSEADQCIRENRNKPTTHASMRTIPKAVKMGEGCNISGYMTVNRVNGNFHFALGEGVERNGKHIHLFLPEDAPRFNTTHIIHELSFGPKVTEKDAHGGLDGVTKVITESNGKTGFFQYFLKVVPTVYNNTFTGHEFETNRYFFTENYKPLIEEITDEHIEMGEERAGKNHVGAHAGGDLKNSHAKSAHHAHMNSILPGIFFIYEIYPFAIVVTNKSVPFSHALIRILALIGGIFTIVGWVEGLMCVRDRRRGRQ